MVLQWFNSNVCSSNFLYLSLVFFDLVQIVNSSTLHCRLDSAAENGLIEFREWLLCNNCSKQCHFHKIARSDTFSNFVILFHVSQWDLLKHATNKLSNCNVSYMIIDEFHTSRIKLAPKCSTAISTIVISVNHHWNLRNVKESTCWTTNTTSKNSKIMDTFARSCPNAVWVIGDNTYKSRQTTGYAWKILRNNTNKDLLGDRTYGKHIIENKKLRIGVTPIMTYVIRNEINGIVIYDGILVNLLKKFSKNLDFQYEFVPTKDNSFGAPANNSFGWNGLVLQLLANETDIALGPLTITPARSEVMDFTSVFNFETYGIMIKQKGAEPFLWGLLTQFSKEVWISIFICITTSILVIFMLEKLEALIKRKSFDGLSSCCWFVFSFIFKQGKQFSPHSWAMQTFMSLFFLFVFFTLSTYCSGLTAMLCRIYVPQPFVNLQGLAKLVKEGKYKVCTMQGTAFWSNLMDKNTDNMAYRIIGDFLRKNPTYSADTAFCTDQVKTHNDVAYLEEIATLEMLQLLHCHDHLLILKERFYPGYIGFGVQKYSPYNAIISEQIIHAVEGGLLVGLEKFYLRNYSACHNFQTDLVTKSNSIVLIIPNFAGPFLILWIGVGLGCICFGFEKLWFYRLNGKRALCYRTFN